MQRVTQAAVWVANEQRLGALAQQQQPSRAPLSPLSLTRADQRRHAASPRIAPGSNGRKHSDVI
jgi:hypothetical protein